MVELKRRVFDVETNGLLFELDRIHVLNIEDADTGQKWRFRRNNLEDTIEQGLELLASSDIIIGHNIIDFDLPAIRKVYPGWTHKAEVFDTQVAAAVIYAHMKEVDFRIKFRDLPQQLYGSHTLEAWGYRLGCKKGTFGKSTDWKDWSVEMEDYYRQSPDTGHAAVIFGVSSWRTTRLVYLEITTTTKAPYTYLLSPYELKETTNVFF